MHDGTSPVISARWCELFGRVCQCMHAAMRAHTRRIPLTRVQVPSSKRMRVVDPTIHGHWMVLCLQTSQTPEGKGRQDDTPWRAHLAKGAFPIASVMGYPQSGRKA